MEEMLRETPAVDLHWTVAFNARILNAAGECGGVHPIIEDSVWGVFDVRLLPKTADPAQFKLLRPVAILLASVKLWPRAMSMVFERYDTQRAPSLVGFSQRPFLHRFRLIGQEASGDSRHVCPKTIPRERTTQ